METQEHYNTSYRERGRRGLVTARRTRWFCSPGGRMTESNTGPPADAGPGGQPGAATASRPAGQARVPQQLGYEQERIAGEAEIDAPGIATDPISAAAKQTWWVVALGGIGLVGLGIALLVWPSASLT